MKNVELIDISNSVRKNFLYAKNAANSVRIKKPTSVVRCGMVTREIEKERGRPTRKSTRY
jgi:hypothetical protein